MNYDNIYLNHVNFKYFNESCGLNYNLKTNII